MKFSFIFFLLLISPVLIQASDDASAEESQAYWDYGIGFGAVHYEHYPAANQFADLALPSPTFQYRGKVLRADDRDGAHLYLLKGKTLTLELSGAGFPALNSSDNKARQGMDNLPWLLAVGPQLVSRAIENWEFGLGAYQAVSTDFDMTRFAGTIFEAKATYQWQFPVLEWNGIGKLSLSFKAASQELQALYYEVPSDKATSERAEFEAHDGFLSRDLTYYQSFKSGRLSINMGVSLGSYDHAANRESPLHKSDHNITALVGFNYVLGGSSKPAIPEEDTSGVINRLRRNRQLQPTN